MHDVRMADRLYWCRRRHAHDVVLAAAGNQSYSREGNTSAVAAGDRSIHGGCPSLARLWSRNRRLATDWLKWSNAGADVANSRDEAQARVRPRAHSARERALCADRVALYRCDRVYLVITSRQSGLSRFLFS